MWPANAADAPAALGVLVAVAVVLALVLVGQSSVVTLIATAALGAVLIGLLVLLARVLRPAAQSAGVARRRGPLARAQYVRPPDQTIGCRIASSSWSWRRTPPHTWSQSSNTLGSEIE